MSGGEVEKLAAQQEAILVAIAAMKDQLDASEWRRKCLWLQANINGRAENLKKRFPGKEQSFMALLEPLDCYANLVFKSTQDLMTVFTCFSLIVNILEDVEKDETLSFMDIWKQIPPLIDELQTLESGDPPSLSASRKLMRDLRPELGEAERVAVRERFDQLSRGRIKKMFAPRGDL